MKGYNKLVRDRIPEIIERSGQVCSAESLSGTVIYLHSAAEGFKTDCLRRKGRVCVSCVRNTCRVEEKYTTKYESAMIRGTASEVTDDKEKIHALQLICARHAPSNMENFDKAVKESLNRTAIWKIDISEITGKANLL